MRLCLQKHTKSLIKEHRRVEELEFRLLSEGLDFIQHMPKSYDKISDGGGRTDWLFSLFMMEL